MNFKKIHSKISSVFKNKKGFSTIEIAISSLIFITVVCAFIDLTTILNKINTMSSTATSVARVLGEQGGVQNKAPAGFKGDYLNAQQLYKNISNAFASSGISEDDWDIYINGVEFKGTSQAFGVYDYGKNIEVKIALKYDWSMISNFIPGQLSQSRVSTRNSKSSFRIRSGDIITNY